MLKVVQRNVYAIIVNNPVDNCLGEPRRRWHVAVRDFPYDTFVKSDKF